MLLPKMQPLLTLRAIGASISPGSIPGSVIKSCVEGPQKAMKLLSEFVLGKTPRRGKPSDLIRRLFDLPTQRIAFASFEISFGLPLEEETLFVDEERSETDKVIQEVKDLLVSGLSWLSSESEDETFPIAEEDAADIVLRALKEFTPATSSKIERMELSGRLLGARGKPFLVTDLSRRQINRVLRERHLEPTAIEMSGLIRELDKDRLTFELREPRTESLNQKFTCEQDLLEDVTRALAEDHKVRIVGRQFANKNVAEALAVVFYED
ncbi:MAG: hypothetical protein WC314_20765 [Vulcanimicrobiota bacterium]